MRKAERAEIIRQELKELYPSPPIPLDHTSAYTLLVAVVLSAQSTDKKVNELTKSLFKVADNPIKMVELGITGIYEYIKYLGLSNQKSKNIYNLSKLLIEKHKGEVPDSFEKLESLPGVGHKTASVVMSQVFNIPSFPVDTHIHRLSQRWGLSNGDSVIQTEKDLKKIFPINEWNTLHLQIIFYGREYCTARGCDGTKCYLCRKLYPKRKKKFICKKP
ncbi:endonuclease III [Prochlorococcus marinus]|uniref:endonuclease III n=1 Tax=Prochlorococcus marinus TaxID=1219 RepID=UPI001ADB7C8C|nr:endonuclease III [Prochlorococcus marinus]MBO8204402.1 endonuclease III [Prochlorococcus marinus CUG1415]MBW3043696.1 endonuclease III [Prochlorococcus marinus str. MU1415]